jgi:predicted nucleotidyltransferase
MLSQHEILQKIKLNKMMLLQKCKVSEIALFGSDARNEQTPTSDIDLMISLHEATYHNLCNTKYFLQTIFPDNKIQIVSKKGIKPKYFEAMKNDLIYA